MSILVPQNFYKQTVLIAWAIGAGNFYVSVKPTVSAGYLVVSPENASLREIIKFTATGTDGSGDYVTIAADGRGLGGTTEQTHAVGENVYMNVTAQTIQDLSDAIDQIVAGGAQDSSTTVKGLVKMSVAPASPTAPIAVGANDTSVLLSADEKAAIAGGGTFGVPSTTNKFATENYLQYLTTPVIKIYSNIFGSSTTQFDITNPSGTTFRYTYDTTGTDPGISSTTVPVGTVLIIAAQNFTAANNGTFVTTGVGSNYFEVTNASGVAENNVTLGTGTIKYGYQKPTGLNYIIVECLGGGGAGGGVSANANRIGSGGGAGGYSRKIIFPASLGTTETLTIGAGSAGDNDGGATGGTSTFGAILSCVGGSGGAGNSTTIAINGGAGGTATGGDINIIGENGHSSWYTSSTIALLGAGGSSPLGRGGASIGITGATGTGGNSGSNYGSGGSGAGNTNSNSAQVGGDGKQGVIIIYQY